MEDSQFKVVGRIGIVQYGMVHIKLLSSYMYSLFHSSTSYS